MLIIESSYRPTGPWSSTFYAGAFPGAGSIACAPSLAGGGTTVDRPSILDSNLSWYGSRCWITFFSSQKFISTNSLSFSIRLQLNLLDCLIGG